MKKKPICLLLSCLLAVIFLAGCADISYREHLDDYVRTMEYEDGFTILQLTDIHWHGGTQMGDETYGSKSYIKKVIEEAKEHAGKIDLIEITGDTFMLYESVQVTEFIDFMEGFGIPYAMIWGNHDREGKMNPNKVSELFSEAAHSLYTEVDHDDVHERGNYVIDLVKDGKVCWQLFQLDSGASYRKGAADLGLTYDYLRDDQYDWLTAEHEKAGADVPAICYYHIAQKDNQAAFDAIAKGAKGYKQAFFKLEGFGESEYAVSTEEVFKKNNVKAAFMGHAHSVDWTFTTPSGITYGLGVKTGTELYFGHVSAGDTEAAKNCGFEVTEDFDLIGASLVTLNDTAGNYTLEHLYLNEREGEDFVLWVKY